MFDFFFLLIQLVTFIITIVTLIIKTCFGAILNLVNEYKKINKIKFVINDYTKNVHITQYMKLNVKNIKKTIFNQNLLFRILYKFFFIYKKV